MATWEKATLTDGADPGTTTTDAGDRVTVDAGGTSWVRILSPKFRLNDGTDYSIIGWGAQVSTVTSIALVLMLNGQELQLHAQSLTL